MHRALTCTSSLEREAKIFAIDEVLGGEKGDKTVCQGARSSTEPSVDLPKWHNGYICRVFLMAAYRSSAKSC